MKPGFEKPLSLREPHLILVEGEDDRRLVEKLIEQMKLGKIQALSVKGKNNFGDYLDAIKKATNNFASLVSIGIVRDADTDPRAAFQSVQGELRKSNLQAPRKPLAPEGEKPRVSVMILPAIDRPGMLETLCLESRSADPAMACVDEYFLCLRKNGVNVSPNIDKAKAHAYLSSRPIPNLRVGEAAQKKYWDLESEAFGEMRKFLLLIVKGADKPNKNRKNHKDKK